MIGQTEHMYTDRTIKHQITKWVLCKGCARALKKVIGCKGKVHLSMRSVR